MIYQVVVTDDEGTVLDNYEVEVLDRFPGNGPQQAKAVHREMGAVLP